MAGPNGSIEGGTPPAAETAAQTPDQSQTSSSQEGKHAGGSVRVDVNRPDLVAGRAIQTAARGILNRFGLGKNENNNYSTTTSQGFSQDASESQVSSESQQQEQSQLPHSQRLLNPKPGEDPKLLNVAPVVDTPLLTGRPEFKMLNPKPGDEIPQLTGRPDVPQLGGVDVPLQLNPKPDQPLLTGTPDRVLIPQISKDTERQQQEVVMVQPPTTDEVGGETSNSEPVANENPLTPRVSQHSSTRTFSTSPTTNVSIEFPTIGSDKGTTNVDSSAISSRRSLTDALEEAKKFREANGLPEPDVDDTPSEQDVIRGRLEDIAGRQINWWDTNGADGKDGGAGRDGGAGKDGADGGTGKDGADGGAGKDGADGGAGKDGADGKDGGAGKDGADGKDGGAGKDGADGKDGGAGKKDEELGPIYGPELPPLYGPEIPPGFVPEHTPSSEETRITNELREINKRISEMDGYDKRSGFDETIDGDFVMVNGNRVHIEGSLTQARREYIEARRKAGRFLIGRFKEGELKNATQAYDSARESRDRLIAERKRLQQQLEDAKNPKPEVPADETEDAKKTRLEAEKAKTEREQQELVAEVVQEHLNEMNNLSEAELADLITRDKTVLGRLRTIATLGALRNHPRIRMALGLALNGATIASAATGMVPLTAAFMAARTGLRIYGNEAIARTAMEWNAGRLAENRTLSPEEMSRRENQLSDNDTILADPDKAGGYRISTAELQRMRQRLDINRLNRRVEEVSGQQKNIDAEIRRRLQEDMTTRLRASLAEVGTDGKPVRDFNNPDTTADLLIGFMKETSSEPEEAKKLNNVNNETAQRNDLLIGDRKANFKKWVVVGLATGVTTGLLDSIVHGHFVPGGNEAHQAVTSAASTEHVQNGIPYQEYSFNSHPDTTWNKALISELGPDHDKVSSLYGRALGSLRQHMFGQFYNQDNPLQSRLFSEWVHSHPHEVAKGVINYEDLVKRLNPGMISSSHPDLLQHLGADGKTLVWKMPSGDIWGQAGIKPFDFNSLAELTAKAA